MKTHKITVPISEEELQEIEQGEEFHWNFISNKNESIEVHIKLETEEDNED